MSDENRLSMPWIDRQVIRLMDAPGHAWLLQGPSGLGQYELALGVARARLCDEPTGAGACGHCASCHAIDVRAHADLRMLMPETEMLAREWPLAEKAQADIDDKKRKPSREIRVDAMRDAIEFAQRTSARGRGKVLLVYPAERMNAITANALLKTLEEPPGEARFVLATEAPHDLLPTIRSRCLSHALHWPSQDEAIAWLEAQGLPVSDVGAMLRAAGGRPEAALTLSRRGFDTRRWSLLPKSLARGEGGALEGVAAADAIELLQKVCHDLLATGSGAAPRFFDAKDLPPAPAPAALAAWSRGLGEAARTAEHPFMPALMIEALVSDSRLALHSKPPRNARP